MKFFAKRKDGGPESTSTGYWLFEIKSVASVVLLRFNGTSRNAFHTHAFHAISWLLRGELRETLKDGTVRIYKPSWRPIITPADTFHKVDSVAPVSWALSFRGPWRDKWKEFLPSSGSEITLTHGRKLVEV